MSPTGADANSPHLSGDISFLFSQRKSVFSLYIEQQFFNSINRDLIIGKTN